MLRLEDDWSWLETWNDQNVKLTLEGKLAEPCVGFVPIPAGHLCTDLSASLPLYLCTSEPLYSYLTLWSWESHPPLLSHHLESKSWNSFENSLCTNQWVPTACILWSSIIEVSPFLANS